jgi:hypothetical protein
MQHLKYSILRSSLGSDIIYDFEKSISFEGDSGPYLQYTAVRANAILKKAKEQGIEINNDKCSRGNNSLGEIAIPIPRSRRTCIRRARATPYCYISHRACERLQLFLRQYTGGQHRRSTFRLPRSTCRSL